MMCCRVCRIIIPLLVFYASRCKAQDSSLSYRLLQRIAFCQIQNTTTKGNFPSYILNKTSSGTRKPDDNVFFATLIQYLLQRSQSCSLEERLIIDSIRQQTENLYPYFQNKSGRLTYNFWRTDTALPFPYTKWIRLLKRNTSLPDDMDDTVLSLMAQNMDSAAAAKAHNVMQAYINRGKNNRTIEKKYRFYGAYSVWYGKNFPPVFDVCVLCNVLSFVQRYHLAWTNADSASLQVIVQAIKSRDYIKQPLSVSPYYGNTSIILYHLARLMDGNQIQQLNSLKAELVITAAKQLNRSSDLLEKVILSSAIIKWGYNVPSLQLQNTEQTIRKIETSILPFFIGNIPSYFPSFYRRLFTQKKWLMFYHYSPAFNDALLFEYVSLLKENQQQ